MATQKMTFQDKSSGGEFAVLVPDPKEGETRADLIRSAVVAAVGRPLTETEFRGYLCTGSTDVEDAPAAKGKTGA